MTLEELSNKELLILYRNSTLEWERSARLEDWIYMEEVREEIEDRMVM